MTQSHRRESHRPPASGAAAKGKTGKLGRYIIIITVFVIILGTILGVGYYWRYIRPFQATVITVDNTSIKMGYFIKRTKLSGSSPIDALETLTREQIIRVEAPNYGITVSPEDVTRELRNIARGDSETISEREFQAWYRQQLNESELSDSEFRDIIATGIMRAKLHQYLAERVPTVTEHVRLHAILVAGYANAQKAATRLEAGADFAELAREISTDNQTKEQGGDLGWVARGTLVPRLDSVIFSLEPGEVSLPLPAEATPTESGRYFLFMVSEKDAAREVDEESLSILRALALENWLIAATQHHQITYNFNSETNAWVIWQLTKQPANGQTQ